MSAWPNEGICDLFHQCPLQAMREPGWMIVPAYNPKRSHSQNVRRLHELVFGHHLPSCDLQCVVDGFMTCEAKLVCVDSEQEAAKWAQAFGTEHILTNRGIIHTSPSLWTHTGTVRAAHYWPDDKVGAEAAKQDLHFRLNGSIVFSMGLDFSQRHIIG